MRIRTVLLAVALLVPAAPAQAQAPAPAAPAGPAPLATPVFSMRRVPDLLARTVAETHLRTDLDKVMTDPVYGPARDRSCLVVSEPGGGTVHYARQPTLGLIPASTLKLVTTSAALAELGPDKKFATEVRAGAAPAADGAVGDLYLVGGGDPLLSTAAFASDGGYMGQPRRSTSIEALADKVVAAGVRRVGRVVGDESRYDTERLVPSWNPRYIANFDISPLSALVVNKSFTSENPPAVATSPALFAASVLTGLLRARGLTVGEPATGKAPPNAPLVTTIESLPLSEVVAEILQNSDNLAAEMLVKELGTRPGVPGSTAAGLKAIADRLRAAGVPTDDVATVDGSGLDRSDKVTCEVMQRVVSQAPPALGAGLPVAGRNGTLYRRFLGTPAAGRVFAKTGSLEGVAGLSGFVTGATNRNLSFSLLANELSTASAGVGMQDRVVNVLAAYPRAPAADELGPRPPTG